MSSGHCQCTEQLKQDPLVKLSFIVQMKCGLGCTHALSGNDTEVYKISDILGHAPESVKRMQEIYRQTLT